MRTESNTESLDPVLISVVLRQASTRRSHQATNDEGRREAAHHGEPGPAGEGWATPEGLVEHHYPRDGGQVLHDAVGRTATRRAAKAQMVIAIFPLTLPASRCRMAAGTWSNG